MKNKYSFESLNKKHLSSLDEEAAVFFKMQHIINFGRINHVFNELNDVYDMLTCNEYYIAHNLTVKKGKGYLFKGRLFETSRSDLILFLNKSHKSNDLRCFLVCPTFVDEPEFVIYLDEEQALLYSTCSD